MASFFRTQRSTALTSNRAGTDQRIHDELSLTVQKMMRHPTNKRCADCLAPNPKFVNIELRTFICEACGRIHAEYQKKNVSIRFATSNLTKNELVRMRHPSAGNEAVNSLFMAKYNPHVETLEHPNQFSDTTTRKNWIYYKYIKRTWCVNKVIRPAANPPPRPAQHSRQNPSAVANMNNRLPPTYRRGRSDSASSAGSSVRLERTHEIILRLQSLSANKRCADCAVKKVRYVNITFKSFVCTPCAVVHSKQLGHEVREIGCDDFSSRDIQRMSGSDVGNDYLNTCYMALYDPVKEIDTPPNGGSSLTFRLSWMMKKYAMKTWYEDIGPVTSMVPYAGTTNQYNIDYQDPPMSRNRRGAGQSWDNQSLSSHSSGSRMSSSLNSQFSRPQQVQTQQYEVDVNRPFRPPNPSRNGVRQDPLTFPNQAPPLSRKNSDLSSVAPRETVGELEVDFNGNMRPLRNEPYEPVNSSRRNNDRRSMHGFRQDMLGSRSLPIDASFRINPVDIRKSMSSNEILRQPNQRKEFARGMQKTDSLPLDFKFKDNGPHQSRGLPVDASFRLNNLPPQNDSIPEEMPVSPPVRNHNSPPIRTTRFDGETSSDRKFIERANQEDFSANPKRSQTLPLDQIVGHDGDNKVPILSNKQELKSKLITGKSRKNYFNKQKKVSFQIPEDQDSNKSSDSNLKEKNPQDPEFATNLRRVHQRSKQRRSPKEDQRAILGGLLRA